MDEILKNKHELPNEYRVINIETVDDYIFIETNERSFLINKDKNVFDVGKYSHAKNIYKMGDDIFAVLEGNSRQELVNIKTKEVYVSHSCSYYSAIFQIDDDYVGLMGTDFKQTSVFNIRSKRFIKPNVDIPVEYSRKVGPNMFEYDNNDYGNQIYQHFIVNQDGDLIYKCGDYFPYFKEGNLILSDRENKKVVIVHDILNGCNRLEILKKKDTMDSNPLIHDDENGDADSICFISKTDFIIADFDMNVIKTIPLDIDYDDVEIQLWGDITVIIVRKVEEHYCIALNIKNDVQIRHKGIWVLPLDMIGTQVIRGCEILGEKDYMFTLYDLEGNEYTRHRASDCMDIKSNQMNKYIFYNVDGTENSLVYNRDTNEEKIVPWRDPQFKIAPESGYMEFGFGIRYGKSWEDEIIDLFDEDFNILYEGLIAKDYQIRRDDFSYQIKNNLLLLIVPISSGPRTYYRKVVLDKDKRKLYDSCSGHLSFIGNFLQVIDDESEKTYYIDSRTGEMHDDVNITIQEFALPDTIKVDGEQVKLIMKKVDKTSE